MKRLSSFLLVVVTSCTGVFDDASMHASVDAPGPLGSRPGSDCAGLCVGEATLTRLTRSEYAHTIGDLFGSAAEQAVRADQLPPDIAAGPFASNEGLTFDPAWVEGYESAAAAVAEAAAADPSDTMGCDASVDEDGCVASFLSTHGPRVFRRPLEQVQRDLYANLWSSLRADGATLSGALEGVLTAMLMSPAFVYRVEIGLETDQPHIRRLDGYEMASRLSYFLFRSTPDSELLAAAQRGELSTRDGVTAQARRLVNDPRFETSVVSFHAQWLGFDGLYEIEVDQEVEAEFLALRPELRAEADRYVLALFAEPSPTLEHLFSSPISYPTPAVASYYGMDPSTAADDGSAGVLLADGRAGVLTLGAFLASHGDDATTVAVHRGLAVRRELLCQHLPAPPPVDSIIAPDPELSTREQLEQKTSSPSCQGCHQLINPPGFAFEEFDLLGRYREWDGEHPVNATGALVDTDVDEPFDGVAELGERLAHSAEVRACAVQQWMRFALGRELSGEDVPSTRVAQAAYDAADHDLRELVIAITSTDAFRHRRVPQ